MQEIDEIRAAVDEAMVAYRGEPFTVVLDSDVRLHDLHAAVGEYRDMGWTIVYESDPLRLNIS